MGQYERLILMAEDELTQYSTDARKLEKLRQKIGLSVPPGEQRQVKETLLAEMPTDPISQIVENQRQVVALPFWGYCWSGAAARDFVHAAARLHCYVCGCCDRLQRSKMGVEATGKALSLANTGGD